MKTSVDQDDCTCTECFKRFVYIFFLSSISILFYKTKSCLSSFFKDRTFILPSVQLIFKNHKPWARQWENSGIGWSADPWSHQADGPGSWRLPVGHFCRASHHTAPCWGRACALALSLWRLPYTGCCICWRSVYHSLPVKQKTISPWWSKSPEVTWLKLFELPELI